MAKKQKPVVPKPPEASDFYSPLEMAPIAGVNLEGRTIIMNPEAVAPHMRTGPGLLWHATSGFGCNPTSRGNTVFITSKVDGSGATCSRGDIAGVYTGPTFEVGDLVKIKDSATATNPTLCQYQGAPMTVSETVGLKGANDTVYYDYRVEEVPDMLFGGDVLVYAGPSEKIWSKAARYESRLKYAAELLLVVSQHLGIPVNISFDLGSSRVALMWPPDCVIPGPTSLEPAHGNS
jgi:hypothetical protein